MRPDSKRPRKGVSVRDIVVSTQYSPKTPAKPLQVPEVLRNPGVVDGFILAGIQARNPIDMFSETGLPFAVLGNAVLEPGDAGADDGALKGSVVDAPIE